MASMTPIELLRTRKPVEEIGAAFDMLDHSARLQQIYLFGREDQADLFERATGHACALARDFVPNGKDPLTEVIHWGINSLPTFRKFQKRFAWPSTRAEPPAVVGYNEQAMRTFTGPGYFTAREDSISGQGPTVVIDYTQLPSEKPVQWPAILPNTARLSRVIYNGTMDWMWKVSGHVSVGRARRSSGWMDNWFILLRQD